jgi:uncharacterized protein YgbK (DUF1537 family)
VAQSRAALDRLIEAGCPRVYFKYASTFDSTTTGNIGPVTEALQDAHDAGITVACPAFPANRRTIDGGVLLVEGKPLAESSMRTHPLNPMTESSLVRLLEAQATRRVGLVDRVTVAAGPGAIRTRLDVLAADGVRHAIVDALDDADVARIADAVADDRLVTGASALAAAIGARLRARGDLPARGNEAQTALRAIAGRAAVLAGSCSAATIAQVEVFAARHPAYRIDPAAAVNDPGLAEAVAAWAADQPRDEPVLVYTSAESATVARTAETLGPRAGIAIERALGAIAARLVNAGVARLVVAGGETSGAVIAALGIRYLEVGAEIDPGVPVVRADDPTRLALALKSGNFGSADFFDRAIAAMA